MIILDQMIEHDGTLSVYNTKECAYYVQYDNRMGGGSEVATIEIDGVVVQVFKYAGDIPEELRVYVYGKDISMTVPEYETGVICVPYWEGT